MANDKERVEKLKALAQSLGGSLVRVENDFFDFPQKLHSDFSICPFDDGLGVDWKNKRVLFEDRAMVPSIIHELGHVFACRNHPNLVDSELDFFGWEYVVYKKLGYSWSEFKRFNKFYGVDGNGTEFGYLSRKKARKLVADCLLAARRSGLVVRGQPVSIRVTRKERT